MPHDASPLALPPYVDWPLFPFDGELTVRSPLTRDADPPRAGEPGGAPCTACADGDDAFIWVDEHWRVRAKDVPAGVPVLVFLESREHVDLGGLDDERACELGSLMVRLERAIHSVGNIGRVHVNRWGDGAEHFHLWFYGRPVGAFNLLGFGMALWEPILPPIAEDIWRSNLAAVAHELARHGGRSMIDDGRSS
jgi:hypothetical protein